MASPAYNNILPKDIPIVDDANAKVRIIAGNYLNTSGGFSGQYIKADYLDVSIDANKTWSYSSKTDSTLFVYLLNGTADFSHSEYQHPYVNEKSAVLFTEGDILHVLAGENGVRMLLLCADRLNEPIAWGGPIVMNTQEELNSAFEEIERGTFIRN